MILFKILVLQSLVGSALMFKNCLKTTESTTITFGNSSKCCYNIGSEKTLTFKSFECMRESFQFYVIDTKEVIEKCYDEAAQKLHIETCADKVCESVYLVDLIKSMEKLKIESCLKDSEDEKCKYSIPINEKCKNETLINLNVETCEENGCDNSALKTLLHKNKINEALINSEVCEICKEKMIKSMQNQTQEACEVLKTFEPEFKNHGDSQSIIVFNKSLNFKYFTRLFKTLHFIVDYDGENIKLNFVDNSLKFDVFFNFRQNSLTDFDLNAVNSLKGVNSIDLSLNKFKKLSRDLFRGNGDLRNFILEANSGGLQLPSEFLSLNKNLKTVILKGNQIQKLPNGIFLLSDNIEEINLSNNYLEELPE